MQTELVIEWRHPAGDAGATSVRCGEHGVVLRGVLAEIATLLEMEGITVTVVETPLPSAAGAGILFNGTPLEDLIAGMEMPPVPSSPCASCAGCEDEGACPGGEEGAVMVPPDLIGRAALKALGRE